MTSRERLLAALSCEPVDYIPCCFMAFFALHVRSHDGVDFIRQAMALGIDPLAEITPWCNDASGDPDALWDIDDPGPRWEFDPRVEVRDWVETTAEGRIIHRQYETPAGPLTTSVRWTDDWKHGPQIPIFSDFITPRATKFLIETDQDLDCLEFLLQPVDEQNRARFFAEAAPIKAFAEENGILTHGGQGVGLDAAAWIVGFDQIMYACFDRPEWVERLVEILHTWNESRMRTVLDFGVDIYTRRSWYEGTDFLTPAQFRRFVLPSLKREVQIAHEYGAKYGFINTSGTTPILDMLIEAGVDVLIGIDPVQGQGTDLAEIRRKTSGRMALWGGVNGFVTIEQGCPADVYQATQSAMTALAKDPGFILSPVDNVWDSSDKTWTNIATFLDTWQKLRGA